MPDKDMRPDNRRAGRPPPTNPCTVSIVIKALNEEKHIASTVESALRAVSGVGGEVILADSYSSDQTVDIACAYPIRVVQLAHPAERSCGAGPQLGYQHSQGDFIYILDGDMTMRTGFLEQALAFLRANETVAGVGGRIVENNLESLEYRSRADRAASHQVPGPVDRLDGGGLYRRHAVEAAGYFSDRNLHSYEEFDLAVRLRSLGWSLWRLPVDAADHFGHDAPPYRLLLRRWRTRYICGLGELVRATKGRSRMRLILQGVRELRIYLAVVAWWCLLLSIPFWPLPVPGRFASMCVLAVAPLALLVWRKRSFTKALYSLASWCFHAAGLLRGVLQSRRPAGAFIASRVIREAPVISTQAARDPVS
jgi:glycosyltransferase involved in cell wall biosynthesis